MVWASDRLNLQFCMQLVMFINFSFIFVDLLGKSLVS